MSGRGSESVGDGASLSAHEFALCMREARSVLWTIAAGVLGAADEAEDVLQEASMMALGKLHLYQRGTNFSAWMGSFVRNVARNDLRKRHRRRSGSSPTSPPEVLGNLPADPRRTVPEEVLAGADASGGTVNGRGELGSDVEAFDDRVLAALRTLGGVQRSCLLLRAVQDLSYREIAEALGIPEGTAMSHVHRARVALRTELSGDGASSATAGPGVESIDGDARVAQPALRRERG